MRVLDADAIDLINRGELSGNGGDNNVGGGITLVAPRVTSSPFAPTLLSCIIQPQAAVERGAAWRIVGEQEFRASGTRVALNAGTYGLEFKPVAGFATPAPQVVTLVDGQIATARPVYAPGARIETLVKPRDAGSAPSGAFPLGQRATLVARPAPGFLFSAWLSENGETLSRNTTLVLEVNGPRQLTAAFVPGTYAPFAGSYVGLHEDAGLPNGFAKFELTRGGRFTGRVSFGRRTFRIRGTLNAEGTFSGTLGKFPLLLEIDRTSPTGVLTGTIFKDGTATTFAATQARFDASDPRISAGRFTMLLPAADPSDPSRPPGSGIATLKVFASGEARFTGSLADGVQIAGRSRVVAGNLLPIYVPTFRGKGLLAGTLAFRETTASDADGNLRWLRPPARRGGLYPEGFDTLLPAVASRYTPPPLTSSSATLRLSAGSLLDTLTRPIEFSRRFVATSAGDPSLRLELDPETGLFSGSLRDRFEGENLRVHGAVLQKTNRASGYFRRPSGSSTGAVELTPQP